MKILLYNDNGFLKPLYDDDFDKKRKLKLGKVYQVQIKGYRNYEFHKKYCKLIGVAWELLGERTHEFFKNRESFRKTIEISAGWFERVYSLSLNDWVESPKSISFNSMSEAEFQEHYDRVYDVIWGLLEDRGLITIDNFNKLLIGF